MFEKIKRAPSNPSALQPYQAHQTINVAREVVRAQEAATTQIAGETALHGKRLRDLLQAIEQTNVDAAPMAAVMVKLAEQNLVSMALAFNLRIGSMQ